jgi:hypothetical protein
LFHSKKKINKSGGEKMLSGRKGQSSLEYALVISVVIAALVMLNEYIKKAMQGRLKESTDQIGDQFHPHSFTTGWKVESQNEATTEEDRDILTGTVKSDITIAEKFKRTEKSDWHDNTAGAAAPAQHF